MRIVGTEQTSPGMRVAEPVLGTQGQTLLAAGVELSDDYIARLRQLGVPGLFIDDPDTADVVPPVTVTPELRGRLLQGLTGSFAAFGGLGARLGPKRLGRLSAGEPAPDSPELREAFRAGADSLHLIARAADGLVEQLASHEVLIGLSSIRTHDSYTFQHSIDVAATGVLLARRAGWDRARVRTFTIGCLLHDIGKVFVDPKILNKTGKLTAAEFAQMKTHPELGYRVIRALAPGLGALVPQVALQHHERQDGSGYPRGLRGGNALGRHDPAAGTPTAGRIHEFGAVAAVADVYDALVSDRPYRQGYTPDRVVEAIRQMSGTHLNAEAVGLFVGVVAPFPVCGEVRVTAGRYAGHRGVVVAVPEADLARPRVRLLFDPAGARVEPVDLDLAVDRDVRLEGTRGQQGPVAAPTAATAAALARQAEAVPLPAAVRQALLMLQAGPTRAA